MKRIKSNQKQNETNQKTNQIKTNRRRCIGRHRIPQAGNGEGVVEIHRLADSARAKDAPARPDAYAARTLALEDAVRRRTFDVRPPCCSQLRKKTTCGPGQASQRSLGGSFLKQIQFFFKQIQIQTKFLFLCSPLVE